VEGDDEASAEVSLERHIAKQLELEIALPFQLLKLRLI
jgi:hypothetical protein